MNLYFLVEGRRTENIVYPKWLSILIPELKQIYDPFAVQDNNYYLLNVGGYPGILKDMINSIHDINTIGKFDYLVICIDADECSVDERIAEVNSRIKQEGLEINAQLITLIQNKCFETWFLGNAKICSRNPQGEFLKYIRYYDVIENDPEYMERMNSYRGSIGDFHVEYLRKMLAERRVRYSKKAPHAVCKQTYLEELRKRVKETPHLETLNTFMTFCENIRSQLTEGEIALK